MTLLYLLLLGNLLTSSKTLGALTTGKSRRTILYFFPRRADVLLTMLFFPSTFI